MTGDDLLASYEGLSVAGNQWLLYGVLIFCAIGGAVLAWDYLRRRR